MKTKKNNLFAFISTLLSLLFIVSIILSPIKSIKGSADETTLYNGFFKGYSEEHEIGEEELHQITRMPTYSNDGASITILVHGQGGEASHFSHDNIVNEYDNTFGFAYETNSLLDILSSQANGHIYWAICAGSNFTLYDIDNSSTINYEQEKENLVQLEKIETVSKHAIIVFESSQPSSYHRFVYEELHTLIDKISYDYLVLTGKIPKVNLISHSRGGLTSMMYATGYKDNSKTAKVEYIRDENDELTEDTEISYVANGGTLIHDHPFNVAGLYSMGTPYWGTDWDTKFFGVAHKILTGALTLKVQRTF